MSIADELPVTNTAVRHTFFAAREVIGKKQLNECLIKANLDRFIQAFPPDDLGENMKAVEYSRLTQTILEEYQDGPDILHRIGRSAFQYAIQDNSVSLNLVRRVLTYLNTSQQIHLVLNSLAEAQKKTNPQSDVWAEFQNGMQTIIDGTCIECAGRVESQPSCFMMAGFLSEAIRWAVGPGYNVVEKNCIGCGDDFCRFVVEKLNI